MHMTAQARFMGATFNLPIGIALVALLVVAVATTAYRNRRKRRILEQLMHGPSQVRHAPESLPAGRPALDIPHCVHEQLAVSDLRAKGLAWRNTPGRLRYRLRHPLADKRPSGYSSLAPRAADGTRPVVSSFNSNGSSR